jgi:hypothetical protein
MICPQRDARLQDGLHRVCQNYYAHQKSSNLSFEVLTISAPNFCHQNLVARFFHQLHVVES